MSGFNWANSHLIKTDHVTDLTTSSQIPVLCLEDKPENVILIKPLICCKSGPSRISEGKESAIAVEKKGEPSSITMSVGLRK